MARATLGAGCFWGVEETFRQLPGVSATEVGFAGGIHPNASYEEVCSGTTGHAEVVQIEFDPDEITFGRLLETFWQCHNPTQVDRQGPDVGTQYRSVIFFQDEEQEAAALEAVKTLDESGRFSQPIATKIERTANYVKAEEHHQHYYAKRGGGSCGV